MVVEKAYVVGWIEVFGVRNIANIVAFDHLHILNYRDIAGLIKIRTIEIF